MSPGAPAAIQLDVYDTFDAPLASPNQRPSAWQTAAILVAMAACALAGFGAFQAGRQVYSAAFAARAVARTAGVVPPPVARRPLEPRAALFRPGQGDSTTPAARATPAAPWAPLGLSALMQRIPSNTPLANYLFSAVGLATLCLVLPDMATAETAAPLMTPGLFHSVADTTARTMADALQAAAALDPAGGGPATAEALRAVQGAVEQSVQHAQQLARLADGEVAEAAKQAGWFDLLVQFVRTSILNIKDSLTALGVGQSAGVAITLFTLLVKGVTLPLNFQQMESTTKMQILGPTVKKLQDKYKANPQEANVEIARLYKRYEINPFAALLPVFVQIPVFIALYRALRDLAAENLLDQPFLFLPSLEGPVFDLPATELSSWLTSGTLPPNEVAAYLALPVMLVASQYASTALQKVPGQETPAWVNYLPLMTGAFAINVPSGLSLYWLVNNLITTGTTVIIRQHVQGTEQAKQMAADMEAYQLGGPRTVAGPAEAPVGPQMSRKERRAMRDVVDTEADVTDAPKAKEEEAVVGSLLGSEATPTTAGTMKSGSKGKGGKRKKR
eukprot:EG_transcript_6586